MDKVYGSPKRQDGLYKVGRNTWELIYGFGKDNESDETGWNYRRRFKYKPTVEEIKDVITEQINTDTDAKILSGFAWRGMGVWLSTENQFNYKAAYDLAVQTNGATLPIKVKFGTDAEPVYFVFESMDDFSDFYLSSLEYVQKTLDAGWTEKDNVDYSMFESDE